MDASGSSHVCSILLVDDDTTTRDVVTVALRAEGYEVLACRSGREALHLLRSRAETCVILLDLQLPLMDGARFRAVQLLDRALAWIPVVVLSGLPGARQEAARLGATAFVWKPVDLDELRAAVASACSKRTAPREEHRGGPANG